MSNKLIRLPSVIERTALSRSTIYSYIASSLLPPPIKLGERAVAWIEDEIDQVNTARIAGLTDSDIKILVSNMVANRTDISGGASCLK